MSDAIAAVRADRDALLEICGGLTAQQWQDASGCPGWSVQDVVAHLANTFWAVVDLSRLPDTTGLSFESAQDAGVQARRGLSPDAVLADYEEVSAVALDRLAELAALDFDLPLGEAGNNPALFTDSAYCWYGWERWARADILWR